MNILVTLDKNYLHPLCVMLTSLFINNPGESFDIFLISDDLTDEQLERPRSVCSSFNARLILIRASDSLFAAAPTLRYYSRAMYYRLLAGDLLPDSLDRILYLDPDILVINPVRPLYNAELTGDLYAACIHKGLLPLTAPVNRIRLSAYESDGYFNSGVLLMNLPQIRATVHAGDIFAYTKKNQHLLILPDQDILNGLYGHLIRPADEILWNYDARKYKEYIISSSGEADMDWLMSHTAILHFCGKRKPWHKQYTGRFSSLYKHYMHLTNQLIQKNGTRESR